MKNQITMLEAFPEIFSGSEYQKTEEEEMKTIDKLKDAIIQYFTKHGYAPTIRELCAMTGLKSTLSVQNHMDRLFEDGFLETDLEDKFMSPRAYRIAGYKVVKE